ncbi:hypothetical protein CTAYLR_000264 [Chrysophaeum taylorii]|uniref:Uncharacterized protein n=1 Tax=Chrysophaeum taylorii TaxID=2483200 RepID=A0AAD7UFY4_9STRA|nr:hypothetical protein CTAYLR_000264 [Chrysophaeum taylorii]
MLVILLSCGARASQDELHVTLAQLSERLSKLEARQQEIESVVVRRRLTSSPSPGCDASTYDIDDEDDEFNDALSGQVYRLTRADEAGGGEKVSTTCAICCDGGCYVAFGSSDCADGYEATYTGHAGGVEIWNREIDETGAGIAAKTLCVDDDASSWSSISEEERLFRAESSGNTLYSVDTACAVCCVSST